MDVWNLKDNPYERLATVLDTIPNSWTPVEDGTHLRVLEWVYTPKEADLASRMKLRGETLEELVTRLEISVDGLEELLEIMAKKGQVRAWNSSTGRRYALIPFVVGVYDEQLNRMDKEFAQLIEDYLDKSRFQGLWGTKPALFKVIPINRALNAELEVFPYEEAEQIIENSKSWGIRECICKRQQELLNNPCNYGTSKCIQLHFRKENYFDDHEITKPISKEEALAILHEAEEAGLVHCSMNTQSQHFYICNCCTCCCFVLRGLTRWEQPHSFVRSNFQMAVDSDLCTGCEECLDRCQFAALTVLEGKCVVDSNRCIGCGVCAIACPEKALGLVSRRPEEKDTPPESVMDWGMQKAMSRGVDPSDLM